MPLFHHVDLRVMWSDTDPAGIVWFGVAEMTARRIGFQFDVRERGTDRLICEASYRVACVDAETFAPQAFPEEIVSLLATASVGPEDQGRTKDQGRRTKD
jgi:acyl-CoA thioesterase FadM